MDYTSIHLHKQKDSDSSFPSSFYLIESSTIPFMIMFLVTDFTSKYCYQGTLEIPILQSA